MDVPCQSQPDQLFHTHLHSSAWPTGHRTCSPDKPGHAGLEYTKSHPHTQCDWLCVRLVYCNAIQYYINSSVLHAITGLHDSSITLQYTHTHDFSPLSMLLCMISYLSHARAGTWGRGCSQWCSANHPASRRTYQTSYCRQVLHNRERFSQLWIKNGHHSCITGTV